VPRDSSDRLVETKMHCKMGAFVHGLGLDRGNAVLVGACPRKYFDFAGEVHG
jgi:hypothetical protein